MNLIAKKSKPFFKMFSWFVLTLFVLSSFGSSQVFARSTGLLGLPEPGKMVELSPAFNPVMVKGLTVHPENPLMFDFIVSSGQTGLKGEGLQDESQKLIKYFLACLTIPEKNWWVNLSPYEKDKIVPEDLGQTDLGRDMLAQDYLLKQITASLIYPEKKVGKDFWDRVYQKAQAQFGSTDIPVNTFNKVWVLADKADVLERNNTAFIVGAHLKVMLDSDYLAMQKNIKRNVNKTQDVTSQIVRDIVLPELEKEVNTGKNFAQLRQIYNALILANWYKTRLKDALLNQIYANQSKMTGIDLEDKDVKNKIYEQYLSAYKKGVFNFIKEDVKTAKNEPVARKYFSGGLLPGVASRIVTDVDPALISNQEKLTKVQFVLSRSKDGAMSANDVEGLPTDIVYTNEQLEKYRTYLTDLIDFIQNISKDFPGVATTAKLVIYSGPPGGGKSLVWDGFKDTVKELEEIQLIDKFVLFHTRGIRPGEKQDGAYYFRTPAHLEKLAAEGKIITTLVNGQLQGLALYDFEDEYDDPVTGLKGQKVQVRGLKEKLMQDKITILEGGLGWYDKLSALFNNTSENDVLKGISPDGLISTFVSPFTEEEISAMKSKRNEELPRFQAGYNAGIEISRKEYERALRVRQDMLQRLTTLVGQGSEALKGAASEIIDQLFIMDDHQQFLDSITRAKREALPTAQELKPESVVSAAAKLETVVRIHKRQVLEAKKVKEALLKIILEGNVNKLREMLGDKDLLKKILYAPAFPELENRAQEAAVQVDRRFEYKQRLYNVWVNDSEQLERLQKTLGIKFTNHILRTLLAKIINVAGAQNLLGYFNNSPELLLKQLKQWQVAYKTKLHKDISLADLLKEEYFELIGEDGYPLNQVKPRALVHVDGNWHQDVRVLMINSKGEILVQKRAATKDVEPGLWAESAGGHVKLRENYDGAVGREIAEELGISSINIQRLQRLGTYKDEVKGTGWFNKSRYGLYIYKLSSEEEQQVVASKADGIESIAFYSVADLRRKALEEPELFTGSLKRVLSDDAILKDRAMNGLFDTVPRVAANADPVRGGIDFTLKNMGMTVAKDGDGVKITIDPQEIELIRKQGVVGFTPVIINISPITSVLPLLGMASNN